MGEKFIMLSLANTDERVRAGKPISPSFLFATMLWHEVLVQWEKIKASGELPIPALHLAMDDVLDTQAEKLAITRRIAGDIKEIWALQPRFEQRSGKRPYALLEHPRFRAAYDFLVLRAESGEIPRETPDWWTDFQNANGEERGQMLLPDSGDKKRRRRRRKKPDSGGDNASTAE